MALRGQPGMCHAVDRRQWVSDGSSPTRRLGTQVLKSSNSRRSVAARHYRCSQVYRVEAQVAEGAPATLVGRIRGGHRASVLMIRATLMSEPRAYDLIVIGSGPAGEK